MDRTSRARSGRHRSGIGAAVAAATAAVLVAAGCTPTTTPSVPKIPTVYMLTSRTKGFFSLPWPNDVRKTSTGRLDVSGMPGVALDPLSGDPLPKVPLLPQAVANAGAAVTDFGTNSAVYFQTSVALDPASLPTPAQSTQPGASVALLDLDAGAIPAPIVLDFRAIGDKFRPDNTLSILPYPGHPLAPGHRYAAVVFDTVTTSTGAPLQPAPLLAQLDQPWSSSTGAKEATWLALRAQRDEVRSAVSDIGRDPSDLVGFTVYRTQAVGSDTAALAATVAELPTPPMTVTEQRPCETDSRASGTQTSYIRGTISMPSFQTGTYPYLLSGGTLAIDQTTHRGIVQRFRPVAFTARVPCGTPPAAGWPIAAFIDGTGGDEDIDSSRPPFDRAGWLVGEIAPGMAGAGDPLLEAFGMDAEMQTELLFYNVLNSGAGRGNSVQQAADHLSLLRALEAWTLDGAALGSPVPVTTNDDVQLISGQSQGAATLPLVADMDPRVDGVLSAAGGAGIYHSVAHGLSRRTLFSLLSGDVAAMDELNPLMQLLQMVVEETDGSNYSASDADFLNLSGVADACVSIESTRHLDRALGLTVLNRQAPDVLYGEPSLEPVVAPMPYTPPAGRPLRADVETNGTHWNGYESATATLRNGFVTAIRDGQTPTVPASTYVVPPRVNDSCAGRWDSPTNTFGR
jgi:hypothetical protein